jgi:hypothetical protein
MRASYLKNKYEEAWKNVEQGIRDYLLNFKKCKKGYSILLQNDVERIAHNAAFLAACEINDAVKKERMDARAKRQPKH